MSDKMRPYVGISHPKKTEVVHSKTAVTTDTHPRFHTVKGPFRTKKAANFAAKQENPNAMANISISELERLANQMGDDGDMPMNDALGG